MNAWMISKSLKFSLLRSGFVALVVLVKVSGYLIYLFLCADLLHLTFQTSV